MLSFPNRNRKGVGSTHPRRARKEAVTVNRVEHITLPYPPEADGSEMVDGVDPTFTSYLDLPQQISTARRKNGPLGV